MTGWGVIFADVSSVPLIIFFIGRILISLIKKFIAKVLVKRNIDAGIQSFVRSLVNILLTILLVVAGSSES